MLTYRDFMFLKTAQASPGLTAEVPIIGVTARTLTWQTEESILSLHAYKDGHSVAEVSFPTHTVVVVKEEPC